MGKTRNLFKKIRANKGIFHTKMGFTKDRNGLDLTKAEDAYIFSFLLCFPPLFLSQLFVCPPQTAILFFSFLFHGDGLDPCLLYNVMNLIPQFIRHLVYQIQALKSISHFHCIIIRDFIQDIAAWSSGSPYFLQFKSEFGNKEFMI